MRGLEILSASLKDTNKQCLEKTSSHVSKVFLYSRHKVSQLEWLFTVLSFAEMLQGQWKEQTLNVDFTSVLLHVSYILVAFDGYGTNVK